MCGIIAVVGTSLPDDATNQVARGVAALRHRGPDASGVHRVDAAAASACLGTARLRVLDLDVVADQPMTNEDRSVWVTYNGELYNHRELRVELERAGHRFRSHADTEALVHLCEEVSGDPAPMIRRLRGMFAFACFDQRTGRFFAARDRVGIKPLYYAETPGGGIAVASEARALVAAGLASGDPNPDAVRGYLRRGVVPATASIFAGVRILPAGALLTWERGRTSITTWWKPELVPDPSLAHPVEATRLLGAALDDAVARHLVADRRVGVFLSSGVDSAAIAAIAGREQSGVRALTVTFPDSAADEGAAAATRAREAGVDHTTVEVRDADVVGLIHGALSAMDQPTSDAINTWLVCRAARSDGLIVCLSGIGGDELFGGYPSFDLVPQVHRIQSALGLLPSPVRRYATRLAAHRRPGGRLARTLDRPSSGPDPYAAVRGLFSGQEVADMLSLNHVAHAGAVDHDAVTIQELRYYAGDQLLRDTDSVSMAHGLEVRVPILDDLVVNVALAIPDSVRLAAGKRCLANAAGVPLTRKLPFALPFDRWMRGPLRDLTREALLSDELPFARAIHAADRRHLLDAFERGATHWSRVWAIAALRLWPAANGFRWQG